MILCDINEAGRYRAVSPVMAAAIDWLMAHRDDPFSPGMKIIGQSVGGNDIFVKYEEPALLPREKVQLEAHRQYIDIQLPLKGAEKMGWCALEDLKLPRGPYNADRDVIFFGDAATTLVTVKPGQMAVFFPEDAHAPNIGLGTHRKIIIKVPVE